MKVCTALILALLAVSTSQHTYKCVFDEENRDIRDQAANNPHEVTVVEPGRYLNGRLLQTPTNSGYGSLRIYLDYTAFNTSAITPGVGSAITTTATNLNFILNALFVAQNFYQKRLKSGQLSSVTVPNNCVDFAPANPLSTIPNYDLLIFALYLSDSTKSYGATGKSCDWVSSASGTGRPDYTLQIGRPSVGRIIFNTYNLVDQATSLTNMLFQSVTTTTLHEIMHILGFDSTLYNTFLDPATGDYYNYTISLSGSNLVNSNRPATSILITPYVKAWAQSFYGCSTLPGMLL